MAAYEIIDLLSHCFGKNVTTIFKAKAFAQCEKMKNLLSPIKKIRQINILVSAVVKTLLSRKFCQISVISTLDFSEFQPWTFCRNSQESKYFETLFNQHTRKISKKYS